MRKYQLPLAPPRACARPEYWLPSRQNHWEVQEKGFDVSAGIHEYDNRLMPREYPLWLQQALLQFEPFSLSALSA